MGFKALLGHSPVPSELLPIAVAQLFVQLDGAVLSVLLRSAPFALQVLLTAVISSATSPKSLLVHTPVPPQFLRHAVVYLFFRLDDAAMLLSQSVKDCTEGLKYNVVSHVQVFHFQL